MANKLKLTRNQLASFLKSHEEIKQFERLILLVEEYLNTGKVDDLDSAIGGSIALSQANAAVLQAIADTLERGPVLADLSALEARLAALEAVPARTDATIDQRLSALESAPPVVHPRSITGWAVYNDNTTQSIAGATRTQITNNESVKIETQLPPDTGPLFASNVIKGRTGDGIVVKFQCVFTPTTAVANEILFEVDVGGAIGVLEAQTIALTKGNGVPHYLSWTFAAYTLDTWQANGGKIYATPNGPGDLTVASVLIQRTHKGR